MFTSSRRVFGSRFFSSTHIDELSVARFPTEMIETDHCDRLSAVEVPKKGDHRCSGVSGKTPFAGRLLTRCRQRAICGQCEDVGPIGMRDAPLANDAPARIN